MAAVTSGHILLLGCVKVLLSQTAGCCRSALQRKSTIREQSIEFHKWQITYQMYSPSEEVPSQPAAARQNGCHKRRRSSTRSEHHKRSGIGRVCDAPRLRDVGPLGHPPVIEGTVDAFLYLCRQTGPHAANGGGSFASAGLRRRGHTSMKRPHQIIGYP